MYDPMARLSGLPKSRFFLSPSSFVYGVGRLSRREQVKTYMRDVLTKVLHQGGPAGVLPRPSVLWESVKSIMGSLRHLEAFINLDVATILEAGLLEQVVAINAKEKTTIAQAYCSFYRELVLNDTAKGGICASPSRKAFVTLKAGQFKVEEYTDVTELEALCLLIGPYGFEQLDAILLDHISMYVGVSVCLFWCSRIGRA
jgi:hypothetical protein